MVSDWCRPGSQGGNRLGRRSDLKAGSGYGPREVTSNPFGDQLRHGTVRTDVCFASEFDEVNTGGTGVGIGTGSGIGAECEVKVEGNVSGKVTFLRITGMLTMIKAGTGEGMGECKLAAGSSSPANGPATGAKSKSLVFWSKKGPGARVA